MRSSTSYVIIKGWLDLCIYMMVSIIQAVPEVGHQIMRKDPALESV